MMCGFLVIIHFLVIVQSRAKELAADRISDAQIPMDQFVDVLVDRALKSSLYHRDVDGTTFAKPGQLANPSHIMPVDLYATPRTIQKSPIHPTFPMGSPNGIKLANFQNQRRVRPSASTNQNGAAEISRSDLIKKIAAATTLSGLQLAPALSPPALAASMKSFSGSKVNKDPDSLLRYSLPIDNKQVRELQAAMENAKEDLGKSLWGQAGRQLSSARGSLNDEKAFLKAVKPSNQNDAKAILKELASDISNLSDEIAKETNQQSKNQKTYLDQQDVALNRISKLEDLMAPDELPFKVPSEYSSTLPVLNGRAKVELVVQKPEGEEGFNVDGKVQKQAKFVLTLDGYNAPVTAGNFVDLIRRGFYSGMEIQRSDGFVVQTGEPDKKEDVGFKENGVLRSIPLEVKITDDKEPLYGSTFDEEGRKGTIPSLPFQAYGSLGMARSEFENDSASSQWFWLLYDSELTPAGRNLFDGRYACFGYTTEGADYLRDIKVGDKIVSAKIIEGADKLKQPKRGSQPEPEPEPAI